MFYIPIPRQCLPNDTQRLPRHPLDMSHPLGPRLPLQEVIHLLVDFGALFAQARRLISAVSVAHGHIDMLVNRSIMMIIAIGGGGSGHPRCFAFSPVRQ